MYIFGNFVIFYTDILTENFCGFLTQRIHNNSTFSFGVNFLQSHHDINIDLPTEFFHIIYIQHNTYELPLFSFSEEGI